MKVFGYIIATVLVVAVIAWGIIYAINMNNKPYKAPVASTSPSSSASSSASPVSSTSDASTITFSDSGFSPSTITVKSGSTVTVKNSSASTSLDFDSDPHPVHTDNPELNIGSIAPGSSKSFTVTKTGSWGYHNHLNPSQRGTLVVQ